MQERLELRTRSEIHLMRRLWHIVCGVMGLLVYLYTDMSFMNWGIIFLSISFVGFFLDFKRLKDKKFNDNLKKIFRPIMRKSEDDSFSGLPFYALGIAATVFLYEEKVAILAIMFLVFADPVASVFGVYFGRDKILPNKTYQGAIASFVTCYFITFGYVYSIEGSISNIFLYSFVGGVFGSISELLGTFNIDDNFTLPVISGLGLTVFGHILSVF